MTSQYHVPFIWTHRLTSGFIPTQTVLCREESTRGDLNYDYVTMIVTRGTMTASEGKEGRSKESHKMSVD